MKMKIQFNSRTDVISKVLTNNERNRLINIISPPLSGKSQLVEDCVLSIQNKPKSLPIKVKVSKILNNEFLSDFIREINIEFGLSLILPEEGILFSESLYSLLKQISPNDVRDIYVLIDDLDELGINETYSVLSHLRNLREKLTAKPLQINFCSICIGCWKPSELQSLCNNNFGSSFPLELFLSDYNFDEVKDLLNYYPILVSFGKKDDFKISYLLEISGGCFTIINYILMNCKDNLTCKIIRNKAYEISKKDFFFENLKKTLEALSDSSKKIIFQTLNNRIVKYENNICSEELIVSGIMKKKDLYGLKLLIIRSWIHEITIRNNKELCNIIGLDYILNDVNELIPPTPSLNKMAYELVLEIENTLRNFVVVYLASINNSEDHPLKMANELGKIREEWKNTTLYDELLFQKNKTINLHSDFIDAYSSISSFLNVKDLTNLILKDNVNKGLNNYFCPVFENSEDNARLFEKFRIIRNQIAHNNLITEKTIDELIEINKHIVKKLIIKL